MEVLPLVFIGILCSLSDSAAFTTKRPVPLDLRRATVMMSSWIPAFDVGPGLVDGQLNGPGICTLTHPNVTDAGWHWVLIDLGKFTEDIGKIRIGTRVDRPSYASLASNMEILAAKNLKSPPELSTNHRRINMDWSNFKVIGYTGNIRDGSREFILWTSGQFSTRWIALRRKKRINFCEVQVLVNEFDSNCYIKMSYYFRPTNLLSSNPNFSLNQCRQICSRNTDCRALQVNEVKYASGLYVCKLYRNISENNVYEYRNFYAEENICHVGKLGRLQKISDVNWRITKTSSPVLAYAVRFVGNIICRKQPCSELIITVEDNDSNANVCSSIDPQSTSMLDSVTFICKSPITGSYIRLHDADATINSANVHISEGFIRYFPIYTTPTTKTTTTTTTTTLKPTTTTTTTTTSKPTTTTTTTTTPKPTISMMITEAIASKPTADSDVLDFEEFPIVDERKSDNFFGENRSTTTLDVNDSSNNSARDTRDVKNIELMGKSQEEAGFTFIIIIVGVSVGGVAIVIIILTVVAGVCFKRKSKYNTENVFMDKPAKVYEVVYKDPGKTDGEVEVTFV